MNNKVYVLQKDLPKSNAGTEFILSNYIDTEGIEYYIPNIPLQDVDTDQYFRSFTVEQDDGTWFKLKEQPKEERITVKNFIQTVGIGINDIRYQFELRGELDKKYYPAIIKAIEFVVNGGDGKIQLEIYPNEQRVPIVRKGDGFITSYADSVVELDSEGQVKEHQPKYTLEQMRLCDDNAYWRGRETGQLDILEQFQPNINYDNYVTKLSFEDFLNSLK